MQAAYTGGGKWGGIAGKAGTTTEGIIVFGTIAGGTAAALAGGNFWQGAVTGLVVSGLNHAMHKIGDNDAIFADDDQQLQENQPQPPKKIKYNSFHFEKEYNLKYNEYLKIKLTKINQNLTKLNREIKNAWNKMKCYEDMETLSRKYEQQDPGGVGRGAASALNGARCESDSVRLSIQRNQLMQQRNVLLKLIQ